MLGKLLRAFDMFGVFNITCHQCGKSKGGQHWMNDDFPGKKFCKQSCLNKFIKFEYKEPCGNCNQKHGTRTYKHQGYEFGSIECKNSFIEKNKLACEYCDEKHGTRTYKHQGYEFGSKECKDNFIEDGKNIKVSKKESVEDNTPPVVKTEFQEIITGELKDVPFEIEGEFCNLKIHNYWLSKKVKGKESSYDDDEITAELCIFDIEILNKTNEDFYLDASDEPLRLFDSKSFSYKLVWEDIPEKYSFLETIGGYICSRSRSRGFVAFDKIDPKLGISRLELMTEGKITKKLSDKYFEPDDEQKLEINFI
jgi:hypothetical protein